MSDAWHLAKIKRFEQVPAGPGITLLRVTARPPRRSATPGERPILLADDGSIVNRYEALPSPTDPKGVLRAAYSVPADFVTPETVFSLLLDDGAVLSLPAPAEGVGRRPAGRAPWRTEMPRAEAESLFAGRTLMVPIDEEPHEPDEPEPDAEPATRTSGPGPGGARPPQERRSDIMSRVIELSAALAVAEREAREQREAREALEAELGTRREAALASGPASHPAHDAALAELESLRGELAQRVEAARAETARDAAHEAARAQEQAEQRQRAVEAELAEARRLEATLRDEIESLAQRDRDGTDADIAEAERAAASVGALERRVAGLELSLTEHGEQIVTLEAERDEAVRVRDALGREATNLRSECARLERELHDALDSVRRMAVERDELSRQAAAFDQVATKARERATEAEEAHQRSQAVLQELETWRGELERRLASMSGELGDARTRLGESDRRLAQLRGQLAEAEAQAELAQAQLRAMREQAGGGDTTVIERAELERMSGELAALRSADAQARLELDESSRRRLRELAAERDELAARVGDLTARLQRAEAASAPEADAPDASAGLPRDPVETIVPAAPSPLGNASRLMTEPDLSRRSPSEQAEIAALTQRAQANAEATARGEITQALLRNR